MFAIEVLGDVDVQASVAVGLVLAECREKKARLSLSVLTSGNVTPSDCNSPPVRAPRPYLAHLPPTIEVSSY